MNLFVGAYIDHKFRKEEKTVKITFIDKFGGKIYFKPIEQEKNYGISKSYWSIDNTKLSNKPLYKLLNFINYYLFRFNSC